MSYTRHKGIVCDNCGNTNFMGFRFKCLICIDYDLCNVCQEQGICAASHLSTHPTQCIITSALKELFFGGEESKSNELPPQSFTCPHCGEPGFSLRTLLEHVGKRHLVATSEVLCPICVCEDSEHDSVLDNTTDNLALHLVLKHGTPNTRIHEMMHFQMRTVEHSSSENSSKSPSPIAQETPIEPMVRIMSQTLADMRVLSLQEESGKPYDLDTVQTESSDFALMLLTRRQLEQRRLAYHHTNRAAPSSIETSFSRHLLPSLPVGFRGAKVFKSLHYQEPLFSIKRKIHKFKKQSETINEIADHADDCAENFLLPSLRRSVLSTSEMKTDLIELWQRAEFVQALLMSMLATEDLTEKPAELPAIQDRKPVYPVKLCDEKRSRKKVGRKSYTSLQPCIHEDSGEDIESTDL